MFALLIAVQACCSFYFLYMQTIFLVFYALVDYGRRFGKGFSFKHFLLIFLRTAGYYFLGVSLAGAILFPTLCEFINSSRTDSQAVHGWQFLFGIKEIAVRFSNLFIPMWKNDNYGLAVPFLCFVGLAACFTKKYRKTKMQVIVTCMMAAYFCPAFWRVTNGFSYVSDRWTYIVYFVLIFTGVRVLQDYLAEGISGKVIAAALAVSVVSISFHLQQNNDKIRSIAYLAAVVVVAWTLAKGKRSSGKVFFLIFGSVCMEIFFLFASWRVCGHELANNFCSREEVQALTERIMAKEGRENGERVERKGPSRADALLAGYAGTTEYFSILNKNTYRFWEKLLISPGIHAQVHHLEGLDGRAVPEALLGVGQYQGKEGLEENPYALAMGASYTDSISSQEFEKLSPLERQAVLLERIVLEEGDGRAAELSKDKILEIPARYVWENIDVEDGRMVPGENARIIVTPQKETGQENTGELYILLSDFQCFIDNYAIVEVGNKSVKVENRKSTYYTGLRDYLVKVQPEEDGTVLVEFPAWNEYLLSEIHLYWYSHDGMGEAIEELRNESMKNVSVSNGKISGEIEVSRDSWVFFPIPFSNDWRVELNGERAELVQANVGFMALALAPGEYEVILKYCPVWFWAGTGSTAAGGLSCWLCGEGFVL